MEKRKKKKNKWRKPDGIAQCLPLFKPKIVKARKGNKAYKRKPKHVNQS